MKILTCTLLFFTIALELFAQRAVFDASHFAIVIENGAVRNATEIGHTDLLSKISTSIDNINLNTTSIVLAQNMIYSSLSNVNSALKNGLAVKEMYSICEEIIEYGVEMSKLASSEPYLVLFSEQIIRDMVKRSSAMIIEVSEFIVKEERDILMDFNSRDALIASMRNHLKIIRGLAYGAWKAVYWAKVRGVFNMLNPFQGYINRDRQLVADIISKIKYLKK
ncbi:hypothetical protein [Pedobacter sp. MW01-1-1]|uniref:hypothetical protein n=1 Tax=Pedobacter sp. MW01-1-1 TaxID=3383027 RepID=UPI003FEE6A8A